MSYWIWSPLTAEGIQQRAPVTLIAVTDSCAVQASDVSALTALGLFPVDTAVLQASESGNILLKTPFVTDTCATALADPSDRVHNGEEWASLGDMTLFVSDALSGVVDQWRTLIGTEVAGTGIAFTHWEVPDQLALLSTETAFRLPNTVVVIGLDDSATPSILAGNPVAETEAIHLSDPTPTVIAVLSVSDSCALHAIDGFVPFPITPVLDTFNRANEGPPPAGWTTIFQAGAKIVGNECVTGDILNEGAIGWNTPFTSVDQEVAITIGSTAPVDGAGPFALLFRMQTLDYLSDSYRLTVQNSSSLGFLLLERYQGFVNTQIGFGYLNQIISTGDTIGVSVIGSTFGALVQTYSDSGVTTGQYAGLWFITGLTATLDNFTGGASGVGGASILSTIPVTDSLAVLTSDAQPLITVANPTLTDTCLLIIATELPAILVTLSVTDSGAIQASEQASILGTISVADTCVVQASEAANVVQNTLLGTIDSCLIGLSDATPLIINAVNPTDSLAVIANEAVQPGPQALSLQDLIAVQSSEVQTSFLATVANETDILGLLDAQPFIPLTTSVTDIEAIQETESASVVILGQSTPITASDSVSLGLIDEVEPFLALIVSDSCGLIIDERIAALGIPVEIVALQLIESVTRLEITQVETLWAGGMRKEDAQFLYAGSYRMGERNPDETRGGSW